MKAKDTITQNAQQVAVHPVPGGTIIAYRYGLVFRVLIESPEGTAEMDQNWVARNRRQLIRIFEASAEKVRKHGLEVHTFGQDIRDALS